MMLVATFGKMPRFLFRLDPRSSSSSAVPSPDPTLLSSPSPGQRDGEEEGVDVRTWCHVAVTVAVIVDVVAVLDCDVIFVVRFW